MTPRSPLDRRARIRVAVTGLGIVSPLGNTVDDFWTGLVEGRTATGPIAAFPTDGFPVTIAGEVRDFAAREHFGRQQLALLDRFSQLGLVAARQAATESGLDLSGELGRRAGAVVGTGVGGVWTLDEGYRRLYGEGRSRLHPFSVPRLMPNAVASQISIDLGLRGPTFAVASACSSATHAIGIAFELVRSGATPVALAGGAEAPITPGSLRAWEALRVLADDACRPFSRHRRGLVLGEGAAILVLETHEHARRRGAEIRGEVIGFGASADADDIVQPSEEGASRAIEAALEDAGLDRSAVGYVNAHGTGTAANDVVETRALRRVFGAHAERLLVSSTKSMVGHSLGAAGAIEAVATLLCLERGVIHPTANHLEPDPECDLDVVPNQARERQLEVAISSSFAFGGLNAVLAFRRAPGR